MTPSVHSPRAAAGWAVAVLLLLTGCAATPAPTQDLGEPSGATRPPTDVGGDATASTAAASGAPTLPYPSAITDGVVADPAFATIADEVEQRMTDAGLPGASLLVLHDGALVEQEAFGTYDLDTVVPIASASKWLSGAAIMTLVDEGRVDLDAPIATYLPDAVGPAGEITTRQLLSFTSGLPDDEDIACYGDVAVTLAACNAQILTMPLLDPPGTAYRYSGTHLHVAAGVAEAITGQTWEELFAERIAEPLAMTATTFRGPWRDQVGAPDGHPAPAGSARSSLGDYGRFLEMLVHDGVAPDGTRVLSAEAIAEMGTVQTADARFVSASRARKVAETPYGLAHWLDVTDAEGRAVVESSPGKFGFRPWIDHANGIAGVLLVVDRDDSREGTRVGGDWVLDGAARAVGGAPPREAPGP